MSNLTSRAYYKARVLLVPLGASGQELVESMAQEGLREVSVAMPAGQKEGALVHDIEREDHATVTLSDLTGATDMMVFIGSKLDDVADSFVQSMSAAGREQGTLIAGLFVDIGGWNTEPGSTSMKVIRHEMDMMITVRKADLALAFIEVIKGGSEKGGTPGDLFTSEVSA
ncbi:hypothetical protein [Glutamicibacter mysorens]|uniref:hypothetical protein n=1 Tax=Glutamicibacter mysorens TaxID=257984 RepID=UPI0020C63E84|nr:hypothetical protein [Glutamicibacter mysorens]UTM45737.1 hypothetical protein XH9_09020 [Glutamicibacter mysorens]